MSDNQPPSSGDFDARLRAAREAQAEISGKKAEARGDRQANEKMGIGMRIALELVAGVIVGTAIGLGLDYWLGTKPWLMIAFFIVGSGAGFMNVIRVARAEDRRQAERKAAEAARRKNEG
ncbi:MAG: AtpZ/AtpI family protein [Reyranellaceae bacterium]